MKNNNRFILLTFDVEEFDLPLEYKIPISEQQQMEVGKKGLDAISPITDDPAVQCTLFTTANFALKFPSSIAELAKSHEIASHTFFHSTFHLPDLKNSREVLEQIISKKVAGLRMPRMQNISAGDIRQAGYKYDASINPTWIPGRYNNLQQPRVVFRQGNIYRVPVSVSPNLRVPLFWLSFKNFPFFYFKKIALQTLMQDGYLSLYFHPWEFTDLTGYALPAIIKRKSGKELLEKLQLLISDLKNEGDFVSTQNFLENYFPENS